MTGWIDRFDYMRSMMSLTFDGELPCSSKMRSSFWASSLIQHEGMASWRVGSMGLPSVVDEKKRPRAWPLM